jgi:hypothetical protein
MDFFREKRSNDYLLESAIVEGTLQLPLHDLCDERNSNESHEVARVSKYPSASANTLVGCITFIEMQIITLLITGDGKLTKLAKSRKRSTNKNNHTCVNA